MTKILPMLLVLGLCAAASATTARRATLAEMVQGSTLVILGVTESREAFWDGTRIYTRVRVRVDEVWAGAAPESETVEVLTLGGVVGGLGQRVSGAVRLPIGRQVALFLADDGRGRLRTVGMSQGVAYVAGDGSDDPTVERRIGGLRFAGKAPALSFPRTLKALRRQVRELSRAP